GDDGSSAEDSSTLESNDDDSSSNSSSGFSDVSIFDDADDMASAVPLLAFDDWNSVFLSKMCKQITLLFARSKAMVYHFPNWPRSFRDLEFFANLPVNTIKISVEQWALLFDSSALASLAESEFASVIFGAAHMLQLHIDNPAPDLGARHAGNMDVANVAAFMARVKEMVPAIQRINIW
ncbi:hypothetical protein LPJ66_010665, partial [Kickxella alabastrina]